MAVKLTVTETPALQRIKEFCSIENLNQIVAHLVVNKPGKVDKSIAEIIRGILLVNKQTGVIP